jgi:hypothetical protein
VISSLAPDVRRGGEGGGGGGAELVGRAPHGRLPAPAFAALVEEADRLGAAASFEAAAMTMRCRGPRPARSLLPSTVAFYTAIDRHWLPFYTAIDRHWLPFLMG